MITQAGKSPYNKTEVIILNLKNLNITIGELLTNPKAKSVLAREFPTMINTPVVKLYSGKTINEILTLAKGKVPQDKIQRIIRELEEI